MRLGLLALTVCGCFSKPKEPERLDAQQVDSGTVDVAVITNCSAVPFTGTPMPLLGTGGFLTADPAITGNQLEVFFTHDTTGMQDYKIWHATRASPSNSFVMQSQMAFPVSSTADSDPAPSSDGKTIAFVAELNHNGVKNGYLARQGAAFANNGAWTVDPMPGLEMEQMGSLDLSPDAKTLYWNDTSEGLHIADWNGATFVDRISTFGTGYRFPAVSADGRELYYNGSDGIYRVTRASQTDSFQGLGSRIIPDLGDPDLSPDGQTLVFVEGSQASFLTRICPQ